MSTTLNPNAQVLRTQDALTINVSGGRNLAAIMKTNLGPKGTLKMLIGGAGQTKITKDGRTLLKEMRIQHPTASMIATCAAAQDDIVGDGTTSVVLLIGEMLNQAERLVNEGVHVQDIATSFSLASEKAAEFASEISKDISEDVLNKQFLVSIADSVLSTKLPERSAKKLSADVVNAITAVQTKPGEPIDLHMVEILHQQTGFEVDTRFVSGLVLDHGSRNNDHCHVLNDVNILVLNVSLEYEKSEIHSAMVYSSSEERERMVKAEREVVINKVKKIIALQEQAVAAGKGKNLVVINQKGIEPQCFTLFDKHGILGIRRAKRRNLERLSRCCGASTVSSIDDMTIEHLGYCGLFTEEYVGEEKFTFLEDVKHPGSCSLLIKGYSEHSISRVKDAIRDGLRSINNVLTDPRVVAGAGALEIATSVELKKFATTQAGKCRLGMSIFVIFSLMSLGIEAYANALLTIPKALITNAGLDIQGTLFKAICAYEKTGIPTGLCLETGDVIPQSQLTVWDPLTVKLSTIALSITPVKQLVLVDEVIRAGIDVSKKMQ